VAEGANVQEAARAFAAAFWQAEERGEIPKDDWRWDFLGDLAHDLEYHEPRAEWRAQNPYFIDDAEAVRRAKETLSHLQTWQDD
jgi:hypothetical protein